MTQQEQKIIKILQEDARASSEKIAVMLGMDKKEVEKIITTLEKSGVIVKYSAIINDEKAYSTKVEALIEVKVTPVLAKGFDSIASEIYQFSEVKSLYLMSGAYDLAVLIEGDSLRSVAGFVSEKLSVMDNVLSTATHFILKKYKIEGVVVDDSQDAKRLVVHP